MENSLLFEGTISSIETKVFESSSKTNINIVQTVSYQGKDGEVKESSLWINCEFWNAKKQQLENLQVGKKILIIDGRLKNETYQNSEGKSIYRLIVVVNKFKIIE